MEDNNATDESGPEGEHAPADPPEGRVTPAEPPSGGGTATASDGSTAAESTAADSDPMDLAVANLPWEVHPNVLPGVCYALAHNRKPVLDSLSVVGIGPTESKHLSVEVTSAWARPGRPPVAATRFSIEAPAPGQRVELAPVTDVKLDDVALADLEDACPAYLQIRVADDAGRSTEIEVETLVYGRTQWLSDPRYMVLTAAFVQPNHPDVVDVVQAASRRLERAGHDSAISGYQGAASGQHHRIAQAIFEELQSRIDHYINPPAHFETLGQMVRPLDDVLEQRHGTCIDLACAYASCLEHAGLHPLIYRVQGHAFAGYINGDRHLTRELVDTWAEVQNYMDSGLLVGVETVCLTDASSFEEAVQQTRDQFHEANMKSVLDVLGCHSSGVRPLPSRVRRGDELVIVIDNGPMESAIIERRDPGTRKLLERTVPARVQAWKNSLLDLSFRNRLLNLKTDRVGLRLLPPLGRLGEIEDRLASGEAMLILPADLLNAVQLDSIPQGRERTAQYLADAIWSEVFERQHALFSTSTEEHFKRRIKRMRSDARLAEEESGANNLYLALGAVRWGDVYGEYRSPVFLVPLRMQMGRGDQRLRIVMDDTQSTVPNYCLVEALRGRENLTLQWFADDMSDDAGLDIEAGLQVLRDEFRDRGLDRKGFTVEQSASIAMLDFKKFRLWKDLNDHWEEFAERPVVRHLIETPHATFADPEQSETAPAIDDTTLLTPQPADGSQLRAIGRALSGQSFVLEGPPGTGKSQTITNLLANATHQGKRVLFVAEKQAALSVVHERLEQVGLGPYCLELHDRGTKPEALRTQLLEALEQRPDFDERHFQRFEDEFAAVARQLDQYRRRLYAPNEAGYSFAGAFASLAELGPGPTATVPRQVLDAGVDATEEARRRLIDVEDYTADAQVASRHPWALAGPIPFADVDRPTLGAHLSESADLADDLVANSGEATELVCAAADADELVSAGSLLTLMEYGRAPSAAAWPGISAPEWMDEVRRQVDRAKQAIETAEPMLEGELETLARTDLDAIAAATSEAGGSFVLGRKRRMKAALGDLLPLVGQERLDPEQAPAFVHSLASCAGEVREAKAAIEALPGLSGLIPDGAPSVRQFDDVIVWAQHLGAASRLVRSTGAAAEAARALLGASPFPVAGLGERVGRLGGLLTSIVHQLGGNPQLQRQWGDPDGVVRTIAAVSGPRWRSAAEDGAFLGLQRWLALQQHLEPLRSLGLTEMCRELETGALPASEAARAFDRGLLTTTMVVRSEELHFDVFDGAAHDRRVKKFVDLLGQRRELAKAAIPFGLQQNRKVQAGVTTGKVGDFRMEVSRPGRRRGKSIRHLIATYPEIVSDLTPCFLMSPDSVAQFLPPGTIDFDLVVFDEASQITVADAIGALGRAKAVVIVGDSRQMPPTKVGQFAGETDEDPEAEEAAAPIDEDSILEEALQAGFDQEWLSWHYRSQDESLISFSNTYYYDQRLATFPAPLDVRPDCGIFYRRVDGQFDHGATRTNAIEAQAVVEEVIRRLDDPATSDLTYGIITLNMQQRNLIESILDESPHPKVTELRTTEDSERRLFVLNLENVQGRERDVIVMGTSFSKRASGGAMPLNFGPLTNRGGEKRLNVAVTRAKRQFVVVSSFDPSEMRDPSSLGMIHLKDYLTRAQAGAGADAPGNQETADTPRHLLDIARRLEERGVRVCLQRGLSTFKVDLALSLPDEPDRWLVAVLVDGVEWSNRPLVVDRDALPLLILRNVMEWPRVARVWLPSWRLEPDDVIEGLVDLVHTAAAGDEPDEELEAELMPSVATAAMTSASGAGSTPIPAPGTAIPDDEDPPAEGQAELPGEERFESYPIRRVGDTAELDELTASVRALAAEIVDREGPIAVGTLLRSVAEAFGLNRLRASRLENMKPLLDDFEVTESALGTFVWPSGRAPAEWRGFRRTLASDRPLETVAPEEIANLMAAITRQSFSISREQLVRACADFFGIRRLGGTINTQLEEVISWAVDDGRLVEQDGTITLPG